MQRLIVDLKYDNARIHVCLCHIHMRIVIIQVLDDIPYLGNAGKATQHDIRHYLFARTSWTALIATSVVYYRSFTRRLAPLYITTS